MVVVLGSRSEEKKTGREARIECVREVTARAARALPTRTSEKVQTPPSSVQLQKGGIKAPQADRIPRNCPSSRNHRCSRGGDMGHQRCLRHCPPSQQHTRGETSDPPPGPRSQPGAHPLPTELQRVFPLWDSSLSPWCAAAASPSSLPISLPHDPPSCKMAVGSSPIYGEPSFAPLCPAYLVLP